jgi:hypothetical protein
MRSIHFDVQGFNRTYWNFFVGLGLFITVFLLLAAVMAWQLGGLPAEGLALMRGITWAFAFCFGALTVVCWTYLFTVPIVFSFVITVCLVSAAWLAMREARGRRPARAERIQANAGRG